MYEITGREADAIKELVSDAEGFHDASTHPGLEPGDCEACKTIAAVSAVVERLGAQGGDEEEPPPLVHKRGSDYILPEPGSAWVEVENLSVYIIRHESGVSVSVCPRFPQGSEAEPAADLASAYVAFADAPDEEDDEENEDDEAGCNRLGDDEHERLRLALEKQGYDVPSGVVAGWATAYFRRADAWAAVGGPLPEELSALSYFARERGAR